METREHELERGFGIIHRPARPMKVVADRTGARWLCDKNVDEEKNLEAQGCWRCGDLAFTRND
jgi:hypothetical protein